MHLSRVDRPREVRDRARKPHKFAVRNRDASDVGDVDADLRTMGRGLARPVHYAGHEDAFAALKCLQEGPFVTDKVRP